MAKAQSEFVVRVQVRHPTRSGKAVSRTVDTLVLPFNTEVEQMITKAIDQLATKALPSKK